ERYLAILIRYPGTDDERPAQRPVSSATPAINRAGPPGIAFVGFGNYARSVLLPALREAKNLHLVTVATGSGGTARDAGERYGFSRGTTDPREIFDDLAVRAVVIATRHDSHARLAIEALRAGKDVFVEKPLALTAADAGRVLRAADAGPGLLMVGFNRRYSDLAVEARRRLGAAGPLVISYRVNAGSIPPEHWVHDPVVGGGRLVGEGCHFVDLVQYLTGEQPVLVSAHGVADPSGRLRPDDNVSVTIRLSGGSVASILYVAGG